MAGRRKAVSVQGVVCAILLVATGYASGQTDATYGATFTGNGAYYTTVEVVAVFIDSPRADFGSARKELFNGVGAFVDIRRSSQYAFAAAATSAIQSGPGPAFSTNYQAFAPSFQMKKDPVKVSVASSSGRATDAEIQQAVSTGLNIAFNGGTYPTSFTDGTLVLVFLPSDLQVDNGAQTTCSQSTCGYTSVASLGASLVPYGVVPDWSGDCSTVAHCWPDSKFPGASSEDKTLAQAVDMTVKMMTGGTTIDSPSNGNSGGSVIDACGLEVGSLTVHGTTDLTTVQVPKVWFLGECIPS